MLVYLSDLRLSAQLQGPVNAPPLVFSHALGTNQSMWDGVLAHLPNYRTLTYDHRGHGGSDVPAAPYSMGALVRDAPTVENPSTKLETFCTADLPQ